MVNFPTRIPDCDSHSPALLDLLPSSDDSTYSTMVFRPLGNSDHVVVSVFIDFPFNSKRDALFHHIAYDYSCADWDNLHDHVRDAPQEDTVFEIRTFHLIRYFSGNAEQPLNQARDPKISFGFGGHCNLWALFILQFESHEISLS